jgi:hypothetical protein
LTSLLIVVLLVSLFFIVPAALFFCFSKSKKPAMLGLIFSAVHLILVISVTLFTYSELKSNSVQPGTFFLLLGLVDMPSFMLIFPIGSLLVKAGLNSHMAGNLYIPMIISGVFGTLQYFLIGSWIGWLLKRKK